MEQTIKPIETIYNGYRFRSRLEARWAVFFDAAGIKYEYESEGFEVKYDDSTIYRYLPDFYLPNDDIYVEVKPSKNKLMEEKYKLGEMVDFHNTPMSESGLMILGQIPNYKCFHTICWFPFYYWNKGVALGYSNFALDRNNKTFINKMYDFDVNEYWNGYEQYSFTGELPEPKTNEDLYLYEDWYVIRYKGMLYSLFDKDKTYCSKKMLEYFNIARQARFEYGETPVIKKVI